MNKFYYFLCNEGSEPFLKEEIKCFYPELTFAYSTKGFVTFKENRPLKNKLSVTFARHFGEYISRGHETVITQEFEKVVGKKISYDLNGEIFLASDLKIGDEVLELIKISEESVYLGKFKVLGEQDKIIGGFQSMDLPEKAPSRAYLKIVQAAKVLGITFNAGESAIEIGSSPGGATFALLSQGLNVIGVDPGKMDPVCLEFKNFIHNEVSIQEFKVEKIDRSIDWFLVDMNLAPEATIRECEKILSKVKPTLKGGFITLKMTKQSLVSKLPFYRKLLERLGFRVVLMTQLPSHKQEFLMYIKNQ